MPEPWMAIQRQEPLDPKKVGRKSHNKLYQNIKITIKLFKKASDSTRALQPGFKK